MRFACGDMRDHIVSYQNDHRPSYWRRRALRQQARLRIDFSEILRAVRFSTFATISAKSGQNERDRPLSSFRPRSIVPRANSRRVLHRNLQFRIREPYEICDLIMLFWITNLRRDHAVPIFCRSARIPSRWAAKLSERGRRDKTRSVQAIPAMDVHRTLFLSDDLMQFDEDLFQGRTVVPLVILIL